MFIIFLLGLLLSCVKRKERIAITPEALAKEYYASSEQEFAVGNYDQAYTAYEKAIKLAPDLENASLLNNILLSWAVAKSAAEDTTLLSAQKRVWLNQQNIEARKVLLDLAVDNENDVIIAFGIGRAPENATIPTIKKRLASRGALMVASAWVGRLAIWSKKGIESPFDVSANVIGVSTIYQTWIGEQFMLLKAEAPLEANLN